MLEHHNITSHDPRNAQNLLKLTSEYRVITQEQPKKHSEASKTDMRISRNHPKTPEHFSSTQAGIIISCIYSGNNTQNLVKLI
mmetsp:Transcript_23647/g.37211  ORF Transcript_23647/g.37211 Transcript_23647/m.37211 type:complete len:83 (+) Transcript_23647:102-350(+)